MGKKEEMGIRIRTMRKSRRMTQEDLARAIGQSSSSITMYETGRREPDLETLEALADVFNVPMVSLITDEKTIPINQVDPEIHIVSSMMEDLPQDQKEQIVAIVRAYVEHQIINKKG